MANKVTLTSAPLVDENADEKTHTHQQHGTERRLYAGVSGCRTVNEKPFYVDRDFHAPSSPPPAQEKNTSLDFISTKNQVGRREI